MSVTPSSTIVGVFRDRSASEEALNALYNAGFAHEQIQYIVPGTFGNFFDDLKKLFTGPNENEGNLADNLSNMGLSDAEVQYYANEHNNGNTILIVRAPDRQEEAMQVLHQYGAYNAESGSGYAGQTASDIQQPEHYTSQGSDAPSGEYNNAQDWGTSTPFQTAEEHPFAEPQPGNIASEQDEYSQNMSPTIPLVHDTGTQDTQADVAASEHDNGYQAPQTGTFTGEQVADTPESPTDVATPHEDQEYATAQATEVSSVVDTPDQIVQDTPSSYTSETQTVQATEAPSVVDTPDQSLQSPPSSYESSAQADPTTEVPPVNETTEQSVQSPPTSYESSAQADLTSAAVPGTDQNDSAAQVDSITTQQESSSQDVSPAVTGNDTQPQVEQVVPTTQSQETLTQPSAAGVVSPEQADELRQLQTQLQTLQQQLQEAKAQLQAAKEQEDQIKSARERQQQLQAARQQLQDIQAELQATLAELQQVQSRIAQY